MLLGGAGLNKPNRRKLLGFCFIFLVLSGCLFQAACGSSSSSSHTTPPPTSGGTPAGTYTVTVTGNASGTQHALPITLTVN
jgi:ABC-type oligopeptide transport system substrate-binding subunit